jgi:UDP-N-acetyl-D-glucosamine dehydrogenase
LNDRGKSVNGARVLILGVAYKKDVADMRESPAIKVIELLEKYSAQITYHDPYVPHFEVGEHSFQSVELTDEALASSDCVVILTDHSNFDYANIVRQASLVVDTRHATARVVEKSENIVLL